MSSRFTLAFLTLVLVLVASPALALGIQIPELVLWPNFLRNNFREVGHLLANYLVPGSLGIAGALITIEIAFTGAKALIKGKNLREVIWAFFSRFFVFGVMLGMLWQWPYYETYGLHPMRIVSGLAKAAGELYDIGVDPAQICGYGFVIGWSLMEAGLAGSGSYFSLLSPTGALYFIVVLVVIACFLIMGISYFLTFARFWLGVFPIGPIALACSCSRVTAPIASAYLRFVLRTGFLFFFHTIILVSCRLLADIWVQQAYAEEFAGKPITFALSIMIGSIFMAVTAITLPRAAAAEMVDHTLDFGLKILNED